VVCIHLLNDYSGSPRVLAQVIALLRRNGIEVDLCTASSDAPGFLSGLDVTYRWIPYRRSSNRYLTLTSYLYSQFRLFVLLLGYRRKGAVFYVNTLLPFGAGLAGRMLRKKVLYHLHEASLRPAWLKKFLLAVAHRCATREVFVSRFLLDAESVPGTEALCVHNALSPEFGEAARRFVRPPVERGPFRVVMICSLRDYKGIPEFLEVARLLSPRREVQFDLVLNAGRQEVDRYFAARPATPNVRVTAAVTDVRPFYERASLLVNLSRPDEWVETFGLTLLEAMAYGVPVIAPPVGGPVELVEDGASGYLIGCHEVKRIAAAIERMASSPALQAALGEGARRRAALFGRAKFEQGILDAILR